MNHLLNKDIVNFEAIPMNFNLNFVKIGLM